MILCRREKKSKVSNFLLELKEEAEAQIPSTPNWLDHLCLHLECIDRWPLEDHLFYSELGRGYLCPTRSSSNQLMDPCDLEHDRESEMPMNQALEPHSLNGLARRS